MAQVTFTCDQIFKYQQEDHKDKLQYISKRILMDITKMMVMLFSPLISRSLAMAQQFSSCYVRNRFHWGFSSSSSSSSSTSSSSILITTCADGYLPQYSSLPRDYRIWIWKKESSKNHQKSQFIITCSSLNVYTLVCAACCSTGTTGTETLLLDDEFLEFIF